MGTPFDPECGRNRRSRWRHQFLAFSGQDESFGQREVISVRQAATDLGLDPETPLLGYVLRESWISKNPELAQGPAQASREAKDLLAVDDEACEALRPMMNANDDAEFVALRDGWRSRIPKNEPVSMQGALAMYQVMAELAGDDLSGGLTELPEGLFWSVK